MKSLKKAVFILFFVVAILCLYSEDIPEFIDGNTLTAAQLNLLVSEIEALKLSSAGSVPLGTIIAWHKSATGTPELDSNWVECNGQTIDDEDSPYDGQAVPDLNSDTEDEAGGWFLRGGSTSGVFQDDDVKQHNHMLMYADDSGDFYSDDNPQPDVGQTHLAGVPYIETWWSSWRGTGNIRWFGSSESRPSNMSVVWIIRVK